MANPKDHRNLTVQVNVRMTADMVREVEEHAATLARMHRRAPDRAMAVRDLVRKGLERGQ